MNEKTKIEISVEDIAKYVSITSAILLKGQGFSVKSEFLKMSQSAIVADIIENDSIKGSIEAFDKEIKKLNL